MSVGDAFLDAARVLAADQNIGADAMYTPAGEVAISLRVTWARDDGIVSGLAQSAIARGTYCHLPRDIIPDIPQRGESVSIIGMGDYHIETAEIDNSGATWRCTLRQS